MFCRIEVLFQEVQCRRWRKRTHFLSVAIKQSQPFQAWRIEIVVDMAHQIGANQFNR